MSLKLAQDDEWGSSVLRANVWGLLLWVPSPHYTQMSYGLGPKHKGDKSQGWYDSCRINPLFIGHNYGIVMSILAHQLDYIWN